MLNIRLICVGKLKEKFYKDACDEFKKRLQGLCKMEVIELKEEVGPAKLEKEADAIEDSLLTPGVTCALCIEGKMLTSEELSAKISRYALEGASRLNFIIGSSEGMSERIKKNADWRLSMSPMTFPHHLARVMVLEQIYRALMIAENRSYHK
ncbi:MAG: 23S rRNA (pseudouridine(1915)-N(3))-methyltransferase RlmH [Clostridia bacterium]|nr:23S rRNA (pseudouridine(1915)-N(3))-methyltransferase RlmH [Clostridia bacterium]